MKQRDIPRSSTRAGRRVAGRAQDSPITDPYAPRHKLPEPARCTQCGAVYHHGRWQWAPAPMADAHEELCAACRRINDKYPAGIVTLKGPLVAQIRQEIVSLVRHQEDAEKAEHPLNRIIAIEKPDSETLVISTTDIHLPRRIGEAVKRAYHGELDLHFDEDGHFVRVDWQQST